MSDIDKRRPLEISGKSNINLKQQNPSIKKRFKQKAVIKYIFSAAAHRTAKVFSGAVPPRSNTLKDSDRKKSASDRRVAHTATLSALVLTLILLLTLLCSCAAGADKTAITAVTIESGKKSDAEITVSATLSDGFIDEHGKKVQIYLIEFPAGCVGYGKESGEKAEIINAANNTVIGAGKAPAVCASAKAARGEIRFTLPFYTDSSEDTQSDSGRANRLLSSFALAYTDGDISDDGFSEYTLLTDCAYISDPEALAASSEASADGNGQASIKGISYPVPSPADAIRLGAFKTVIKADLSELIYSDTEVRDDQADSVIPHIYGGRTYYFSSEAIGELDRGISAYSNSGIEVYLRLVLCAGSGKPGADALSKLYYGSPDGSEATSGYAINIGTPDAARLFGAAVDLLTVRYLGSGDDAGIHGKVSSFIIGNDMNDTDVRSYSFGASENRYIRDCETLARYAYLTVRSHGTADIFISLGKNWESGGNESADGAITSRRFLTLFAEASALGGDYPWNVALKAELEIPAQSELYEAINAASAGKSLSLCDLSDVSTTLSSGIYRYAGSERRRLIIDSAVIGITDGGTDEENTATGADTSGKDTLIAAAYAYCYMNAVENGVSALIYGGDGAAGPARDSLFDDVFGYIDVSDSALGAEYLDRMRAYVSSSEPGDQKGGKSEQSEAEKAHKAKISEKLTEYKKVTAGGRISWVCGYLGEEFSEKYFMKNRTEGFGICRVDGARTRLDREKNLLGFTVIKDYKNYTEEATGGILGIGGGTIIGISDGGLCADFPCELPLGARGIVISDVNAGILSGREALALVFSTEVPANDYPSGISIMLNISQGGLVYIANAYVQPDRYGTVCFDISEFSDRLDKSLPASVEVFLLPAASSAASVAGSSARLKLDAIYSVNISKKVADRLAFIITVVVLVMIVAVLAVEIFRGIFRKLFGRRRYNDSHD